MHSTGKVMESLSFYIPKAVEFGHLGNCYNLDSDFDGISNTAFLVYNVNSLFE